jgi:hypothetical protein
VCYLNTLEHTRLFWQLGQHGTIKKPLCNPNARKKYKNLWTAIRKYAIVLGMDDLDFCAVRIFPGPTERAMTDCMADKQKKKKDLDSSGGQGRGRPGLGYETDFFSIRIRKELNALINQERAKVVYAISRQRLIEVLIEEAMAARGYNLPWLKDKAKD